MKAPPHVHAWRLLYTTSTGGTWEDCPCGADRLRDNTGRGFYLAPNPPGVRCMTLETKKT